MITEQDLLLLQRQTDPWLASPQSLPISLWCGEDKICGIPERFSPAHRTAVNGGRTDHIFTGTDPKSGLRIETTITLYNGYPAADIVTYLTNTGQENTPLLHDILAFDGLLLGPDPYLYTNSGDFCSPLGYETVLDPVNDQFVRRYTPQGGRPCDQQFPYYKLTFGDNTGLCLAIGWPAQWMAEFSIHREGMRLLSGQEITSLYLMPGECIRTPKITLVAFEGDADRGTNVWRRWYNAHVLRKEAVPMMCALHGGGGVEFTEANEANQLEHLQKAVESPAPINAWWIDAGWYECDTPDGKKNWMITGSWRTDPKRFPRGLKPIGDFCRQNGIRFLLWFEPERLRAGTDLQQEHPEWLLSVDGLKNFLLNIGIRECCDWLIDKIDRCIKDYGISIYRQDYNIAPLRYWRENEPYDRRGMNENLYVQGYLRFWDTLLSRNPGLLIDSCASGGRRNDLETMRRSVPLHPTDYGYGYHPIQQAFARTLSSWLPYYRICGKRWENDDGSYIPNRTPDHRYARKAQKPLDFYSRISYLSPFLPFSIEPNGEDDMAVIRIWQFAAPLMVKGDYHPLSEAEKSEKAWFVNEFYSPEEGKGFLQAVRNRCCQADSFCACLRGLEPDAFYRLTDFRSGKRLQRTGRDLCENGLEIRLPARDAVVWCFEKAEPDCLS